ncbi:MAG: PD40 domain-containing protein [Acidobacteriota bacterium]|nr:MAG: PD40 domain-containing protein [Acidobacteriota bacterium]
MILPRNAARVIRFGVFEADLMERALYRNGLRVKLQDQPFEVLVALLERPGETVTREELYRRIWPEGIHVEFDHSLSTAVLKIRRVLNDSATNPRFVETVSRNGYRFISPVERVRPGGRSGEWGRRSAWGVAVLVAVSLTVAGAWYLVDQSPETPIPSRVLPVTSYPGWEWMSSFSPDGEQIAFTRCEPGTWVLDGNCDLHVKYLKAEASLRLTTFPGVDGGGAWSPDGRWIAFLRIPSSGRAAYFLVQSTGGSERKLVDAFPPLGYLVHGNSVSWFPDGEHLAVTRAESADDPLGLFLVSTENDDVRRLTSPPAGSLGDSNPAVSPNGRFIAFSRRGNPDVRGVFLLELTSDYRPRGEPLLLVSGSGGFYSPAWTPDGEEVIFVSNKAIWRKSRLGGQAAPATRIPLEGEWVGYPAISPDGHRLAYSTLRGQDDIMHLPLTSPGVATGKPGKLAPSTRSEMCPMFSPDGNRVAFISVRSGSWEVWVCDSDGSNVLRISSCSAGVTRKLIWSPDGAQIAFPSTQEGLWSITIVPTAGGNPRQLETKLPWHGWPGELTVLWASDGEWLVFTTDPENPEGLWKVPRAGRDPVRTTREEVRSLLVPSAEGQIYYEKRNPEQLQYQSLWSLNLSTGQSTKLLDSVFRTSYSIADTGIYFVSERDLDCRCYHLQFIDAVTGEIRRICDLKDVGDGLSVSPDGRSLLYTERLQSNSDIMVAENFR